MRIFEKRQIVAASKKAVKSPNPCWASAAEGFVPDPRVALPRKCCCVEWFLALDVFYFFEKITELTNSS